MFYYNVGGKGKHSQGTIALVTLALFFVGPQIINFVPRVIAGVIMLHLSTDLIYEAVVASRGSLDAFEYCSVVLVGFVVTITGFVPGSSVLVKCIFMMSCRHARWSCARLPNIRCSEQQGI